MACNSKNECVDKEKELNQIDNILDQYIIANENQDFTIIEKYGPKMIT